MQGDKNAIGVKIVLKYVPAGGTVPNSAKFLILELSNWGCAAIISILSEEQIYDCNCISAQQAGTANGTKLIYDALCETPDTAAHQLWILECEDRYPSADQEWDLVDSSGHCDWDGSSKYMSMVSKGANAWNTYIGDDVLRPDGWNRVQDVYIKDVDSDSKGKGAFARTHSKKYHEGLDYSKAATIEFYLDITDNFECNLQRQKTVTYELGHALGLYESHKDLANLMTQGAFAFGTSLSLDDKAEFSKEYASY